MKKVILFGEIEVNEVGRFSPSSRTCQDHSYAKMCPAPAGGGSFGVIFKVI